MSSAANFWSHLKGLKDILFDYVLGLNEMYVWFLLPTYPNFFNPTLNIKMVFEEKIPKMGTFSDFVTIFFVKCYNKIFDNFPTYLPKFCWYATGTTHTFHLGLSM